MATTTNFGWETPDDTDLVKDGALAMRTLGNSIDSSFVDLKGGTTGQVLAKASNTDLDYTWVTQDDANAIQNAIVDAKGDLIAASAADTPARLAVGNNGETLVADSSASTGLRWQGNFAAGKNAIINGAFDIWQRGTSFTPSDGNFTADRFNVGFNGSGATRTISRQTFTPGAAPVSGYEYQYFLRFNQSVAGTGGTYNQFIQRIEDVRTFANQTVTISFWAKAASNTTLPSVAVEQYFGLGGSGDVATSFGTNVAVTTSWQRFTFTATIPSISGKTIGTGSYLKFLIGMPLNATFTVDIWGIQIEAGNTATAFQTATGTLAGELQAAQRYFIRFNADQGFAPYCMGDTHTSSQAIMLLPYPTTMRTPPSLSFDTATDFAVSSAGFNFTASSFSGSAHSTKCSQFFVTVSGTMTPGRACRLTDLSGVANGSFIDVSAEL